MKVLDLFSAAAGGWSLGLHRAGFETVAACEWIDWRRALYAENNPGVLIYDDVRTLTADRLRADLGALPDIVVGSPPCQDISSANTKGKGVDGERSGLFFEAIRIIGEVRPRWFALENSANLRTRGADAVLAAVEDLDYACWATVVRAGNVGANHERPRSWIIGCDTDQIEQGPVCSVLGRSYAIDPRGSADTDCQLSDGRAVQSGAESEGRGVSGAGTAAGDFGWSDGSRPVPGRHGGVGKALNPSRLGHEGGRSRRHGTDGDGRASAPKGLDADSVQTGHALRKGQPGDVGSPQGRPLNETMQRAAEMEAGSIAPQTSDKWAYARQIASLLSSTGLTGPSMTLPVTYGWMMGYPPGWLSNALRSAVIEGRLPLASSSKRSATPSSRKSQKP
ncbi:MAG TPA: DNA methyltransferase [Brevundimonas sp.]|nr:DNA methyltransferase [Brevundimonas sp.]